MGRKNDPILERKGRKYARWYDASGKKIVLSLDTTDYAIALDRLPIVKHSVMSWRDYIKSTAGWTETPEVTIPVIATEKELVHLNPPQKFNADKKALKLLLQNALKMGIAQHDSETGEWKINIEGEGDIASQLDSFKKALTVTPTPQIIDKSEEIKKFYAVAVPQMFIDKIVAERNGRIWLQFLQERKIVSWTQINDTTIKDFELWRGSTPIKTEDHPDRIARTPSREVVTRHIRYLSKSFDLAVDRSLMHHNPLKFWKPAKYQRPKQEALTVKELKAVLGDPEWKKDYISDGIIKKPLVYTFLAPVLLLFVSCKRRSEICKLRIDDINFKNHYAAYTETKNKSKPDYGIDKAFFLTPEMESLLKRVIGKRKEGYVFSAPVVGRDQDQDSEKHFKPDALSLKFDTVCATIVPKKKISIKNLRQTATNIMEMAGMSAQEIDNMLGHYKIKTALPSYLDQSADAVARRLSKLSEKGGRVLCDAVKSLF